MLNIFGVISSALVSVFLVVLAQKTKLLRRGMLLLSAGIFVGLVIHSFFELLESLQIIGTETLLNIMPIFVSLGAILILLGGVDILCNVMQPIRTIIKNLKQIALDNTDMKVETDAAAQENELSFLSFLISDRTKKLLDSREKLMKQNVLIEQEVQKRTKELQEKVDELEKFFKVTVGREMRMKELKERVKEAEANEKTCNIEREKEAEEREGEHNEPR